MPELPEVETVVRDLRPLLVKRRIAAVETGPLSLRRPWDVTWGKLLIGRRVLEIRRRGKWIIVVTGGDCHLLFHLGMTGQMRVVSSKTPRLDHTHLVFSLDRGGKELRFRDIRRFGSATLFPTAEALELFFAETKLGPEPFDLTPKYFHSRLAATRRNLKAVLLDQTVVAGVGNIYADEALFEAKLHPARLGCDTTKSQSRKLQNAIQAVLHRAIEFRGSTIRNYVGGSGLQGKYQEEFAVYGRTGEPCRRCKTNITRIRLAGRSTHFCPRCQ